MSYVDLKSGSTLMNQATFFYVKCTSNLYVCVYILVTNPHLVMEVFLEREGRICCYKWLVVVAI